MSAKLRLSDGGQGMTRIAGRVLMGVVLLLVLLYAGDYGVWRARVARGGGMGAVTVSVLQVTTLKGNRESYFPEGSSEVSCSVSLFPQAGAGACWWVERHRTVFDR